MANPNPTPPPEHSRWKPGQSGNPAGPPKGNIHLSTHIQNALNDEKFELKLKDGTLMKEMPIKAIIKTAIAKSISGDTRAMEWLAKHGYGEKVNLELTGGLNVALVEFIGEEQDDADEDQSTDTPTV